MAKAAQQQEVGPEGGFQTEEARRIAEQHRTHIERQKQELNLQRENILSQKTSHPSRRAALVDALTQIEAQIAKLG